MGKTTKKPERSALEVELDQVAEAYSIASSIRGRPHVGMCPADNICAGCERLLELVKSLTTEKPSTELSASQARAATAEREHKSIHSKWTMELASRKGVERELAITKKRLEGFARLHAVLTEWLPFVTKHRRTAPDDCVLGVPPLHSARYGQKHSALGKPVLTLGFVRSLTQEEAAPAAGRMYVGHAGRSDEDANQERPRGAALGGLAEPSTQ